MWKTLSPKVSPMLPLPTSDIASTKSGQECSKPTLRGTNFPPHTRPLPQTASQRPKPSLRPNHVTQRLVVRTDLVLAPIILAAATTTVTQPKHEDYRRYIVISGSVLPVKSYRTTVPCTLEPSPKVTLSSLISLTINPVTPPNSSRNYLSTFPLLNLRTPSSIHHRRRRSNKNLPLWATPHLAKITLNTATSVS